MFVLLQVLEEVRSIRDMLERVKEKKAKVEEKDKIAREWRVVSMVFDRMIFIVYVFVNFTGLLVIIIWTLKRDRPTNDAYDASEPIHYKC